MIDVMLYALSGVRKFLKSAVLKSVRVLNAINIYQKYFENPIFYLTNPTLSPHILFAKEVKVLLITLFLAIITTFPLNNVIKFGG